MRGRPVSLGVSAANGRGRRSDFVTFANIPYYTADSHYERDPLPRQRRHVMTTFVTRQRLTIAIAVSSLVMLIAPIAAPTAEMATASAATPVEVIESLEGTFGIHQGERRNHAKGTCAVGEFVATAGAP